VDVADIIREVAAEYEVMTAQTLDAAQADGLEKLRAAGAQITDLSAEERQAWAERLQTLPARKAKEFTDLGYDGPAIFNAYFKAAEEAGFTFPVPYSVE
jgi:TRAP-type C4-dicarboxylate transport system substrate-binding protein